MPALEAARARFEQSKQDEIADIRKLHQKRQEPQLGQFLKNQTIVKADISGIGTNRKSTLGAYGFGSAFDIHRNMDVPGFGDSLIEKLLTWRQTCILQFRYNPNIPLPPAEVNAVKIKHAQHRQGALSEIRGGASNLGGLESQMKSALTRGNLEILELARALAQAKADLEVIS